MMRYTYAVLALVGILAFGATALRAQDAAPVEGLSQADLEDMLGPIALYPDSLLANVLAASVYPQDVTAAYNYVQGGGSTDDLTSQPWEPPVQAVAKVPEVLSLLAENIDWTTAIGQAYLVQPADVTAAIQALRQKAEDNDVLQSNDYQTVVQEGSTIVIESAQPDVVYVPQYNPEVVYVEHHGPDWGYLATGAISFGTGILVGAALDGFDCDWHGGCVSWGHWGGYHGDVDFNRNVNVGDINVGNRPRPGNEGERWRPNRDKIPMENGRPRTNELDKFRGEGGRQAMSDMRRPAVQPSGRPGGAAARPGPGTPSKYPGAPSRYPGTPSQRPGGVSPSQQPLKKVSPPKTGGYQGARMPSRSPGAGRPATPSVSSRKSYQTPSAFNRSGASSASRSRGSVSRSSAGQRSSGASRGGGSRGGSRGGHGGGGRGGRR